MTTTITHQQVIDLIHMVPEEHLQSLYDFTLFLKWQQTALTSEIDLFGESAAEIEADEVKWSEQYDGSRDQLRGMAREAAAEFRAGRTQPMEYSSDGRLLR